jgi:hypothetical protein
MYDRKLKSKRWHDRRCIKLRDKDANNINKKSGGSASSFIKDEIINKSILPFLNKLNFIKRKKCTNKVRLTVPLDFSFSTNAEVVIDFLQELVYYVTKRTLKKLYIDHSETIKISLSASLIMDIILMETEKYTNENKRNNLALSGKVPNNEIGILLEANGVLHHLGFISEKDPTVETLDLIYGTKNTTSSEDGASEILKYFTRCLDQHDLKINSDGKREFAKLLGEVLDNCKIHAGENVKWYALGFYHNKNNIGKIHIAILNFGNTIYESLNCKNNVTVSDETYDLLKNKTEIHSGFFNDKWDEEALWTLLSLQHGVSRLRDSKVEKLSSRGKGTIDMISSFEKIGRSHEGDLANFDIISGNTQIVFNFEKYPSFEKEIEDESRILITFNDEKSLDYPPDFQYVKKIKNKFPGTIISMEFFIDPEYINNTKQAYIYNEVK